MRCVWLALSLTTHASIRISHPAGEPLSIACLCNFAFILFDRAIHWTDENGDLFNSVVMCHEKNCRQQAKDQPDLCEFDSTERAGSSQQKILSSGNPQPGRPLIIISMLGFRFMLCLQYL